MRRLLLTMILLLLAGNIGTLMARTGADLGLADPALDGTLEGTCLYEKGAEPPCGPGVRRGKMYPFRIYTHCGLKETWFNGERWHASPETHDDRLGFNSTGGTIELLSPDEARFRGPDGLTAIFRRGPAKPWICF